jgi:predicted phage terminase large subunit-like protein
MHASKERVEQSLIQEYERRKIFGLIPDESTGFIAFCNAFGYELAKHHRLIAAELEKTAQGPYNVIICMPPGHAKSRYASVLFPTYVMGRFPEKSIVMASHTANLAHKWGRFCRRIIMQEKYKYLFKTELRQDSKAADRFELENGSEYFACGMLGGVAGQRADLTILDDPVKSFEEAGSPLMRDKVWDAFIEEFGTREKPGASTIIMMTRRHEDDIIGRVLNSPGAKNWNLLSLPAIAEDNDPMGREPGEALWPDYIPLDMLMRKRESLGVRDMRMWNSLYQQRPTIEEGFYFKREWVQLINKLPSGLVYYGASDYAVSEGRGDYTVHIVIGHDQKTDDIYVVKIWRRQTTPDVWITAFLDLCEKYKPLLWAEESGQIEKSVGPFLEKQMRDRNLFVLREQFGSSTDKPTRARAIQGYFARKKVFILNDETWTPSLISELLAFPDGTFDDQVDTLSLIGRMLADMYLKQRTAKKKTEHEYKANMITLPSIAEKIGKKDSGGFKKF